MTEQEIIMQVAAESPNLLVVIVISVMLFRTAPQFLSVLNGMRKDAQEREARKIKDARSRDEFQARMLESQRDQKDYMNKTFEAINKTQSMIAEQIALMKKHDDNQGALFSLAQDTNKRIVVLEEQTKTHAERLSAVISHIDNYTNERN